MAENMDRRDRTYLYSRPDGYRVTQTPTANTSFATSGGCILVGHCEILSKLAQERGITVEEAAVVIAEAHIS